ncbi:MAG: molybdenum cofactor guanylyltransferase [Bacillota bacterium]
MAGIVVAGGRSSRFGRDKASLPFGGGTLAGHVVQTLRAVTGEVIVVAGWTAALPDVRVPVVPDLVPDRGPLGGIHAGLHAVKDSLAVCVACDMPFLRPDLLQYMLNESPGYDAVVPCVDGLYEPLHAVYAKSCLPVIERALATPGARVASVYPELKLRLLERAELERFGDPAILLFNVNTLADYQLAIGRLEAAPAIPPCRSHGLREENKAGREKY